MRYVILACALVAAGCATVRGAPTPSRDARISDERQQERIERLQDEFNALVPNG